MKTNLFELSAFTTFGSSFSNCKNNCHLQEMITLPTSNKQTFSCRCVHIHIKYLLSGPPLFSWFPTPNYFSLFILQARTMRARLYTRSEETKGCTWTHKHAIVVKEATLLQKPQCYSEAKAPGNYLIVQYC